MSWEDADFDDFKPPKEDSLVKNQWDDEDKPDLSLEKESWEDEDKPERPTPKPNPPKKKKAQLKKEQEQPVSAPLTQEEKRRRQEEEERADFEHSKSLLGLDERRDELGDLSVVVPTRAAPVAVDLSGLTLKSSAGSEPEFEAIAQLVAAKVTPFSDNTHYTYLVKALLKQLVHNMDAEEVREVGKSVDLLYNEKVKQRKGKTNKKATTAKKAVNLGRESLAANDEEDFDEANDFM